MIRKVAIVFVCVSVLGALFFLMERMEVNRQNSQNTLVDETNIEQKKSFQPNSEQKKEVRPKNSNSYKAIPKDELRKITEYADAFDMPSALREELLAMLKESEMEEDSGGIVREDDLSAIGLSPRQISQFPFIDKDKNMTVGFKVSDKGLNEIIFVCFDSLDTDGAAVMAQKSGALTDMGLTAISDGDYVQAEKIFSSVVRYYPDTESAFFARLELRRILSEENRMEGIKNFPENAVENLHGDFSYKERAIDSNGIIAGY
ncbi:MAG: hypothetical protein ABH858_06395 [Candidatus Omnitrophota bacterium]